MNKAYLNCVTKVITFALEDQKFKVDLTEGDLESSTNAIKCRGKIYDTSFNWDDERETLPSFTLYPVIRKAGGKNESSYFEADWENPISYEVIIDKGNIRDYFSLPFVNGFQSWAHTYGVLCDLTKDMPTNEGRISFLETLSEWAFEFEEQNQYTDWEETQWDETLEEFLTKNEDNGKK